MRYVYQAVVLLSSLGLIAQGIPGQITPSTLSVGNYQLVGEQRLTRAHSQFAYRAELVNTGVAQPALTATVVSSVPSIQVVKGMGNLHFPMVPAGGRVFSSNTFVVIVDRSGDTDFSNLHWSFNAPVANAGPDQTVPVGSTATLNGSASTNPSGLGTISYEWVFVSRPPGTRAVLQNGSTLTPTFVPDVAGDYILSLTVDNGLGSDTSTVTVSTVSSKPIADAGPDQTVRQGGLVTLSGANSHDADGQLLSYSWTLILKPSRSNAVLSGANTVSPTFTADADGAYTAQLIVSDSNGSSAPAFVSINTVNTAPVANAGPNQSVGRGANVQLDGSASTDVDGDPLTYSWSLISVPTGSQASLNDVTIPNPTFTADVDGTYVAQLIVNDGNKPSTPSTVTITTNTLQAPTANAGPAQSLAHGSTVTLSGTGTDPQNLSLTYHWSLTTRPNGSVAVLANPLSQNPTFLADVAGTYVAQLIVNNGTLNSAPSNVTVSSTNTAPVANAGPPQTVNPGSTVTLDGGASSDAEQDALTYSWSLLSSPVGSSASLLSANIVSPTFVADVAGLYIVQLMVNDGYADSAPVTVSIRAGSSAGLSLSPDPLNLTTSSAELTVTIPTAAGSSGLVVTLAALDTTVVSVPATATVPPGLTTTKVTVTPLVPSGGTTILASAAGYQPVTVPVNISSPSFSVQLSSDIVAVARTVTATITLSGPAPAGGLDVNVIVDFPNILSSPQAPLHFNAGQTTATATITGVGPGIGNVSATAPGWITGSHEITVVSSGAITVESNKSVGVGQTMTLRVSLISPAPVGGVTVSLISSDPSKLSVTPTINFSAGATLPDSPAQITGIALGSASVSASAAGFTGDTQAVQVNIALNFAPPSISLSPGSSQNLTLNLSGGAPAGGLLVTLNSSSSAATVPSSVSIPAGASSVTVPVNAVSVGTATITASTAVVGVASGTATVNVIQGLVIGTSSLPAGVVGQSYSVALGATGGTSPYTFTATNLPAGLNISAAGVISGTPTVAGTATVAITATDSSGPSNLSTTVSLPLTVNAALAVSTTSLPGGAVGSAYNTTVTATGGVSPYTFTATGLPAGLSISSTGVISGTPTAAGSNSVVITVTDSLNPTHSSATATLSLPVAASLAVSTTSLPNASKGTAYAVSVGATGGVAPYSFSATGLPAGLNIDAAGQISGTPTAAGVTSVVITVHDSSSPTQLNATATLQLTVDAATLVINTGSLPNGSVGNAYNATVTAGGGTPPYTFTATGLPAGLSISTGGQISGTPTNPGPAAVTVTVTDASSPAQTASVPLNIQIAPAAVAIIITALPSGTVGTPYSAAVAGSGGTLPYVFTASGLPAGLNIAADGSIGGTPTTSGASTVMVTLTDSTLPAHQTVTVPLTLVIAPRPLQFGTLFLPDGQQLTPYAGGLTVSGGTPPYNWTLTAGTLPNGLSLNASTGAITGIPAVAVSSTPLTFRVIDSGSSPQTAVASATLTITPSQGASALMVSSATVGKGLQTQITVTLTQPSASAVVVTVSSSNPGAVALAGRSTDSGTGSLNVQVAPGTTSFGLFVQGLQNSGSGVITANAGGYTSGSSTINLAQSGFVLAGPNGVGSSVTTNQGVTTPFTVSAAQLDSSGRFAQIQQLMGGSSATVTLSNSAPSIGTVTPASVTFSGGTDTLPAQFKANPSSPGTTVITASVPSGFNTPSGNGNVLPVTVQVAGIIPSDVIVGKGLETTANVALQGTASNNLTVTIVSNDPSRVLLSTTPTDPGSTSITMIVTAGHNTTPDFYVYGVGTGSATYNASAAGFGNANANVTVNPSGFVLSGGFGGIGQPFFTTTGSPATGINVYAAMLDSTGAYSSSQSVAGGPGVDVSLTSSDHSVGTISPTVTFAPGSNAVLAQFQPVAAGSTTLQIVPPSGFTAATEGTIAASVITPRIRLDGGNVGHGLQRTGRLIIGTAAPAGGVQVTLTSDNPAVTISNSPTTAGSMTVIVTVAPGQLDALYYVQGGADSGTATITGSAANYASGTGTETLTPSGVVIGSSIFGPGFPLTVRAGQTAPVTISTVMIDGLGNVIQTQPVAGGANLNVTLTNTNSAAASIPSPIVISAGQQDGNSQVSGLTAGSAAISVVQPSGFSQPAQNQTTLLVTVQ